MRRIQAKCVVVGSRGVGKTHLISKYMKTIINKDIEPTIASFFTCTVPIEDVKVKLVIWDTAGQERFKSVAPMYYRNANAAILVFDLTQYKTFADIKSWIQELHRNVLEPMILTLVGNKLDLIAERAVSHEEAFIFATSVGANYFETSAEDDQGLEHVFTSTAFGIIRLANEGKTHSLRQYNSCDSISAYTNNNTAFSHMASSLANSSHGLSNSTAVLDGITVEGDEIQANATGRLEMETWSISNIALGEEVRTGYCW